MTARRKIILYLRGIVTGLLTATAVGGAPAGHADPTPPPAPPHITILPPWCFPDPTVCGWKYDPQQHGGWYQP